MLCSSGAKAIGDASSLRGSDDSHAPSSGAQGYVALSRPPSLAQLMSVGLPDELRRIIEGGPPEGILSRFKDMFKEKEEATQIRAAEVMRELGWDTTD